MEMRKPVYYLKEKEKYTGMNSLEQQNQNPSGRKQNWQYNFLSKTWRKTIPLRFDRWTEMAEGSSGAKLRNPCNRIRPVIRLMKAAKKCRLEVSKPASK